jgi:hypothetical protein
MARKGSKPPRPPQKKAPAEINFGDVAPPKMPKRGLDANVKQAALANVAKEAEAKKPKRALAATVETPSVFLPAIIWLGILVVGYAVAQFDKAVFGVDLSVILMFIVGGASLLFVVGAPIYRNYRQLRRPFARAIVIGGSAVALLVCGFAVVTGATFGDPVAKGVIPKGKSETSKVMIHTPGTHYRLFLQGRFPSVDQKQKAADDATAAATGTTGATGAVGAAGTTGATGAAGAAGTTGATATKKAPPTGNYKLEAAYDVQLRSADGRPVSGGDYAGKFEQERTYRRVSKRAHGAVEVVKTLMPHVLNVPAPGDYELQVAMLGDQAEPQIEFAVYADRQFPIVLTIFGALTAFLFGLVDWLIKPLRIDSYFAVAGGIAYGFAAYFAVYAMPNARFNDLAVSLLIGGVMGAGLAYGVCLASAKLYQKIHRKWQLNLG